MSGDLKCPACIKPRNKPPECYVGRPGCVRADHIADAGKMVEPHSNRENPAPDSAPAGADVPVGIADIVDRALTDGSVTVKQRALVAAHAEIARLRADVERLTRQVDHWIGYARTTETYAARLEDRRADLAARAADLALKAQAVAKADRAALATRVAEAVREACAAVAATHSRRSSLTNYNFTANTRDDQAAMAAAAFVHDEIIAMDLRPIVAAAIKKEEE